MKIVIHTCDKCGRELSPIKGSHVSVSPGGGEGNYLGFDLCNACHEDLWVWVGRRVKPKEEPRKRWWNR